MRSSGSNRHVRKLISPIVKLTGQIVNSTTGQVERGRIVTRGKDEIVVYSGKNEVRHEGRHIFFKKVKLNIEPYSRGYNKEFYGTFKGSDMVEPHQHSGSPTTYAVGEKTETYFTLNGKNPIRTKSNLWTGRNVNIRENTAGMNEVILKVRTYGKGTWSDVTTIRFRIVKKTTNSCNSMTFA